MFHPGKKLLFMGGELAQFSEWNYEKELDWNVLSYPAHSMFKQFIKDLNRFYLKHDELWELDDSWDGFSWIDPDDRDRNLLSFKRKNSRGDELIVISNFAAIGHLDYYTRLSESEKYELLFSSDNESYGGNGRASLVIEGGMAEIPRLSTSIWKKVREV